MAESAKPGKPPPAEPREARREGAGGAQRRARHAERRGENSEPHQSKPHWGTQTLPHHIFPLRAPHARPAGGGTNAFCFPSLVAPAPPRLPELSVTRSARGRFSALPRYNHRAPHLRKLQFPRPAREIPEKFLLSILRAPDARILPPPASRENSVLPPPRAADKRFRLCKPRAPAVKLPFPTRAGAAQSLPTMQAPRVTRNKRHSPSATQTSCFNLPIPAHSSVFATVRVPRNERHSPPLPQKAGAEGWGIPLGRVLPPRRANLFRRLFPSSGKAAPAERKQTIFDCEESQVKLQYPCKTKNNKLFFINHITRSVHLSVFPARCRVQFSPPPSILRNSG